VIPVSALLPDVCQEQICSPAFAFSSSFAFCQNFLSPRMPCRDPVLPTFSFHSPFLELTVEPAEPFFLASPSPPVAEGSSRKLTGFPLQSLNFFDSPLPETIGNAILLTPNSSYSPPASPRLFPLLTNVLRCLSILSLALAY